MPAGGRRRRCDPGELEGMRAKSASAAILPLILLLALALRLGAVLVLGAGAPAVNDKHQRYDPIARSLLAGEGFSRDGRPSAASPPVYPLLLAAVYATFGESDRNARIALAVVDTATVGLVFALGLGLLGRREAVLAGGAAAVLPYSIFQTLMAGSDVPFLFLHTAGLLLLGRAWIEDRGRWWAAAGALFGLATLCRAVPLLLPAALAALLLLAGRGSRRHRAGRAALLVAAFAAVVAPWIVRNALVFDRFVPVQQLGGFHLFLGTVDTEGERWQGPYRGPTDPLDQDAYLARRAWEKIRRDPAGYAGRLAYRTVRMWNKTHSGRFETALAVVNGTLLALAALGVALHRRRRRLLPLLAVLAYFVAVHTVLMSIFRYLLPVVPILLVLAAVPVARWLPWPGGDDGGPAWPEAPAA
jgi:4-amino-4-deoxy-L-arabinose transferase-like glycosyltransferase